MNRALIDRLRGLAAIAAAALLAACASGPPKPQVDFKPDYDFTPVHRIAFYHKSGEVTGDNPIPLSDITRERVDTALEQALEKKGFDIVDANEQPDMYLSWHLVTQEKTDVRTYQTPTMGVGYGRYGGYNRYSLYNCWGCGSQTEVSVQNYTEGTFIVDMIDPKLKKSVWRGLVQSKLKGEPQTDQQKYNETADAIFASFPPPPAAVVK